MFPHKPVSILGVLTLTLVLLLCSPWSAIAQFADQRLIPLNVEGNGNTTDDPTSPNNGGEITSLVPIDETLPARGFKVYGRAPKGYSPTALTAEPTDEQRNAYVGAGSSEAGILVHVPYGHIPNSLLDEPDKRRMPDLETFFDFGGTLELVIEEPEDPEDSTLARRDIVISEIMWGVDRGVDNEPGTGTIKVPNPDFDSDLPPTDETPGDNSNNRMIEIAVPQLLNQEIQWIELYNTTNAAITETLYFLFTPFVSYPTRDTVTVDDGTTYKVIDSVDTLFAGLWKLPGKSGDRPNTAFVSAYRDIDYNTVEDLTLARAMQLTGIPFGANPNSWKATTINGRRNTDLKIRISATAVFELPSISTPGAKHVTGIYFGRLRQTPVRSNVIVINEVRNDTSDANVDWVELKNISSGMQEIKDWELSIVKIGEENALEDNILVDLPEYTLASGDILLLLNDHPSFTPISAGFNAADIDEQWREGATIYVVDARLDLPNTGKFMLLLRNKTEKNGKDENIQDYAGNGFFADFSIDVSTQFWPRIGQYLPSVRDTADFGDNTFVSPTRHTDIAWQRKRYQADDGHHIDAWEVVGAKGGLGYDPNVPLATSPGTPGYEKTALRSGKDRLVNGEISISEIMYDSGPTGNIAQWIELYNSSQTQAVDLTGWELYIRNLFDDENQYIGGKITFKEGAVLPNQTFLIAFKKAGTDLPDNRVYNIYVQNRRDLNMPRSALFLNPKGFYLRLTDTGDPDFGIDNKVVDEVGNITASGPRATEWELPQTDLERRRSIVRLYGIPFRPTQNGFDGEPDPPEDGQTAEAWNLFPIDGHLMSPSFYGLRDDLANPGFRSGGPLPVTLASFRPVRTEDGTVLIKWRTESELNNAGFNILRSENRHGDFKVINVKGIIPGHGTSSEQHLYSYTDTTAKPNVIYYYRIEDVSLDGTRRTHATVRLKGDVSPAGKLTTRWGELKASGK